MLIKIEDFVLRLRAFSLSVCRKSSLFTISKNFPDDSNEKSFWSFFKSEVLSDTVYFNDCDVWFVISLLRWLIEWRWYNTVDEENESLIFNQVLEVDISKMKKVNNNTGCLGAV